MARTSTPKRKAPAKAASKPTPRWQAVFLRLPRELVAELDAIAAADRRPRSKMIEIILADAAQAHRQRTAA